MKILITLDGSQFAEAILEPIGKLAAFPGVDLHLIEVVSASTPAGMIRSPSSDPHSLGVSVVAGELDSQSTRGTAAETNMQADERTRQAAGDYLRHVSATFFSDNATREVVLGEDPAEAILNYARREQVDLIAIASHGRTGLARMIMGSVAEKLLEASVAPLYVMRPGNLK